MQRASVAAIGKAVLELFTTDSTPALRIRHEGAGNAMEVTDVQGNILFGIASDGGQMGDDPNWIAEVLGLQAWTFDPAMGITLTTHTSGNIHAAGVYLRKGQVLTKMGSYISSAAVAPTHFILGIYDGNFNLVAQTADSPNTLLSTGYVEVSLTAPYTVPASGWYYFTDLYAATTTMPVVLTSTTVTQAGRSQFPGGTKWRMFNPGTINSFLPSPIVPATSGAFNFIYAR